MTANTKNDEKIKDAVRQHYGAIAQAVAGAPAARTSCCGPSQPAACGCGCGTPATTATLDSASLYPPETLAGLPDSVTEASLGCGDPIAIAELRPGEVVLDLGAGGGIDCFLAAQRVGPAGRVIGLDMTPEMIKLARRNARKLGVTNVEFQYGEMEEIPLPDASVDVIISNCVINLSPDKDAVFGEAFRVLRPAGRLRVSDIVLHGELPAEIRERLDAWAGCVAGALQEEDYLAKLRAAGFQDVQVLSRQFVPVSEVLGSDQMRALLAGLHVDPQTLDNKAASVRVGANKPA